MRSFAFSAVYAASFLFAFSYGTVVHADTPKELKILRITPEGEDIPSGQRQIVIQFNRPVVPVGDMARESNDLPIEITPALACQWRWLNTSALSCNLDQKDAIKAATRYEITVKTGIKAEDGATTLAPYIHSFITQRPDVSYVWFNKWLSPTTPTLRVEFNQPVTISSVENSLAFISGNGATSTKYALKAEVDPLDSSPPAFLPLPGTNEVLVTGNQPPRKSDDALTEKNGEEARRIWIVKPTDELPENSAVQLNISAGLISALGTEKGIAERSVSTLHTLPSFRFLGIECTDNDDNTIFFQNGKEQTKQCDPLQSSRLVFSSPVLASQIKDKIAFTPQLNQEVLGTDIWGNTRDRSSLGQRRAENETYSITIPAGIKAATTYSVIGKPPQKNIFQDAYEGFKALIGSEQGLELPDIKDEFGRPLTNPIDVTFRTDDRKPNFEIIHLDAVIESQIDSEVPLYVNNLDKTTFNYRSLTTEGTSENLVSTQDIPKVQNIQFAIPFDVRSMLKGKSGLVYGFLDTQPVVQKSRGQHRLFAQVTPYQVHVKLGHFNSLVWVTDMATGQPVPDARVTIYKDAIATLAANPSPLSTAQTSENGIATLAGTVTLDPQLTLSEQWEDNAERLIVRVDKGDEMALLPVGYTYMIESYRSTGESVYPYAREQYGHLKTWGTTAQGVYRAGDTIQYKLYVRDQNNETLTTSPADGYKLEIMDPTGNTVHEIKSFSLNVFGAYAGEFPVSKQAPVGWYSFRLTAQLGDTPEKYIGMPLRVLVSDFTPASFKVSNQLNGELFRSEQDIEVSSQAQLYSGGAYTDADIRVTATLNERPFTSKHPVAKDFIFSSFEGTTDQRQIFQKIDRINAKGENALTFSIPPQDIYYGRLNVESAVQDDRGKYFAAQAFAEYAGVDRFVGLRLNDWLVEAGKEAAIHTLVVDEKGNPVGGTALDIAIERQDTKAAQVKGAGNAYVTEFTNSWVEVERCSLKATAEPLSCAFTPKEPGYYRAVALIKDTKGKTHRTEVSLYVIGNGQVVWNSGDDYSLEIIPEQSTYKVGDTARYLVKNPYPNAKALITIERYGVLDHFVQTLEGSTPVISFPVKPDYIPGFYLSVTVFSPRVDKPIEGQVDLGKPTFKSGYVTVPIKDQHKEMLITAKTDREIYKPRENVTLDLHAEPRFKDKDEPIEFAVAVLDEAVFDLIAGGKNYFDPYKGFYELDNLDLRNYSLLTRLVGRQKFEKKGANPGGDGGSDLSMRNLFKFVSYWNPSIQADAAGNAKVSFDVPDNLTGWRVLVMAVTPTDRLGLGEANFKVNRPTEIRAVMPNQVMEGDRFDAGFSVMNRTDKPRELKVTLNATGAIDADNASATVEKTVTLEPYKRTTVYMPVNVASLPATRDESKGQIHFTVTAEDGLDADGYEHSLVINKRRTLEAAANYGSITDNTASENIAFPDKIHTDIGDVTITLSPSVIGNIEGAFTYIKNYPYSGWEQLLTKGAMAASYKVLKDYLPTDFSWDNAASLPQETLDMAANFQTPSGGMAYFSAQDQYTDPYLSAYTAMIFNSLRKQGYSVPTDVENKLHSYLNNLLRQESYPDFYDQGMASTVRAVALAALAEHGKVSRADLERYRPHLSRMSLLGQSAFLKASVTLKDSEAFAAEAAKRILSHANQTGGKFIFSETLSDSYSRILASPLRENCAILSAFTAYKDFKSGQDLVGDVPSKLVRMITQSRGSRTHWENTQENVFCMQALLDYAQAYETDTPNMQVAVSLDKQSVGEAGFSSVTDEPISFVEPISPAVLGKTVAVDLARTGQGRLYYTTQLRYAPLEDKKDAINAGMEIRREYSVQKDGKWELLTSPFALKAADVVRVDLYLSLPAPRNFVVVNDPVAGGLEPVNRDLANSSVVDADAGDFKAAGGSWWFQYTDWMHYNASRWSFYHRELRHDAVRFYSDYLPAGNYHLSYTAQAIASGTFSAMPTHAEEMYDPDVFGKGIAGQFVISAKP